jgi:hypothetical protein
MAIDIYIQPDAELPDTGVYGDFVARFEDEGCHFYGDYLFQKVEEAVGQEMYLLRGAVFSDSTLDALSQALLEAKTSVASQPDTWTEYAGLANQEEVYVSFDKQEIMRMLDTIEAAAEKAKVRGAFLAIAGD